MSNSKVLQPTINIGVIGHVSNGKTTLVEKLTLTDTRKFSKEQETNKTIRLGYANAKIYKCDTCTVPQAYQSGPSSEMERKCIHCDNMMQLVKHISFVDSPGHNLLMATMLNGTCIMDSTMLITSLHNTKYPAPQTIEHMIVAEIMDLDTVICANKVDLVKRTDVESKLKQFRQYLTGTKYETSKIIPMSANFNINTDVLCQYICECIPEPEKNLNSNIEMIIVRSFNVNKQNISIEDIQGGVIGGSIIQGTLKLEDEIVIIPGFVVKNPSNETAFIYQPIRSTVHELYSDKTKLEQAIPGGLIAVKLSIDPYFTGQDRLIGNILITQNNDDYKVFEQFTTTYSILKDVNDISTDDYTKITLTDIIVVNCNAKNVSCKLLNKEKKTLELKCIDEPICVKIGGKITLSKKTTAGTRLIGFGYVKSGTESKKI